MEELPGHDGASDLLRARHVVMDVTGVDGIDHLLKGPGEVGRHAELLEDGRPAIARNRLGGDGLAKGFCMIILMWRIVVISRGGTRKNALRRASENL